MKFHSCNPHHLIHWEFLCRSSYHCKRTTNPEEITCVICRDRQKKLQTFPAIPTFPAIAAWMTCFDPETGLSWIRKGKVYLEFTCPVCGKLNQHRAVIGVMGGADGLHDSACGCWQQGYNLIEDKEKSINPPALPSVPDAPEDNLIYTLKEVPWPLQ